MEALRGNWARSIRWKRTVSSRRMSWCRMWGRERAVGWAVRSIVESIFGYIVGRGIV